MRRLLELWGKLVGDSLKRGVSQLKPQNQKHYDPDAPDEPGSAFGCLLAVGLGFLVGVGLLAFAVNALLNDRGESSSESVASDSVDDNGSVREAGPTIDPSSAAFFTDPENPSRIVPGAGTWSIDNGMFVPNCGPEDPEPDTAADTGTIDVWASGTVLELTHPDGISVVFARTTVSNAESTYVADVGFVEIELAFDSPTKFDATILYSGDDACVRRSAEGSLTVGDPDRQHGAEEFPGSIQSPDVSLEQAAEGTIAIVMIDGETYEFFPEGPVGTCDPDFFGGFHAVLYTEGFADSLNLDLVPDGSRVSTASMTVRDRNLDLVADEDGVWPAVADGTSAVVDFAIDGSQVAGAVSFINEDRAFNGANYPLDSIEATFTVTCGS